MQNYIKKKYLPPSMDLNCPPILVRSHLLLVSGLKEGGGWYLGRVISAGYNINRHDESLRTFNYPQSIFVLHNPLFINSIIHPIPVLLPGHHPRYSDHPPRLCPLHGSPPQLCSGINPPPILFLLAYLDT